MTVWFLDNSDCSGVFSTREKAIESFHNCAKRCGWVELEHYPYSWGDEFIFAWKADEGWKTETVVILGFVLDEDNGI